MQNMKPQTTLVPFRHRHACRLLNGQLAFLVTLLLSITLASAQTLQFRFSFEDSGTTTSSGPDGALGTGIPLTVLNFTGAATDFHGGAGSGVQGTGQSLNFSSAVNAGTAANSVINGPLAYTTNNSTLSGLGVVTNFTATIWFKQFSTITNTQNRGGRLFMLGGTNVTDNNFSTNGISLAFQTTNALYFKLNNVIISAPTYFNPLPTNVWLYVAMVYDGTNAMFYYGTEATPAKLLTIRNVGAQPVDFGGLGNLLVGNRLDRTRGFSGWIDEVRFYTGSGDANSVENIRRLSTPIIVSSVYPDGMSLMQGTKTFSILASSANGINTNGINVAVNGVDVSSNLVIGGSSTSRTVTYTGLPVNQSLPGNAPLNASTINIRVTDNGGIIATNSITYDDFSPTNFTWEAEDYDFGGGQHIDNPRYAFEVAADTYWQQSGTPPIDYNDNGGGTHVYRSPFDLVATELSFGVGANGGPSVGELMRQKVLDALALDNSIREVDVGNFDGPGVASGLPNWLNYTRTYPAGAFNVYTRVAYGATAGGSTLSQVTNGWGTASQSNLVLGTFTLPNTGGWQSYQWVPLRDNSGNLVRLNLQGGTNTFQLTANAGGGGNNNFLMLTPANTNLPVILGIYPNGTNLLQPSSNLTFTVSSPAGVAINTNSIKVLLTVTNIQSAFTTNITSTNGLVITGPATNRNVSCPLLFNSIYTAVISATDANGNPANSTVNFDTYNPSFTWEAEDYDHDGGVYIDTPQTNAYAPFGGVQGIDTFAGSLAPPATLVYRPSGLNTEVVGDKLRLAYLGTGFADYDVGWNEAGNWGNYTRTLPGGDYNIFMRGANGSQGAGSATMARVTSGVGTTNQTTVNMGTFSVPITAAGTWQTYVWVPLRDTSGNLVKLTGGSLTTLRVTSGGGFNANFYALFPANTNLPVLANIKPTGTTMFQSTNTLSFNATSTVGIATNSIQVTVNGVDVSTNLTITGSSTNRAISYPHLQPNSTYTVAIKMTDVNGNVATTSETFDTFSAANYTWEAEDFDYGGGQFIDNPQTNGYAGLSVVTNVDTLDINIGGGTHFLYRPNGSETEVNGDLIRSQWNGTNDYSVGFFSDGEWLNFTRHYPAGTYNVYGRMAAGGGDTTVLLAQVSGGWGTTNQTTSQLGAFSIVSSGWESYSFVPLRDNNGNLVSVTFNGSTNTLQVGRPPPAAALPDVNVNFLMLAPVFQITGAYNSPNMVISFPTQAGFKYQVQYKTNLADATWTTLGSAVSGDGTVKSVNDLVSSSQRFYTVFIQ